MPSSFDTCLLNAALGFTRFPVVITLDKKDAPALHSFLSDSLLPAVTFVSDDLGLSPTFSWSSAFFSLGQELGHLVLDCRQEWNIEKLCALAGAVKGGHLLIMIIDAGFQALSPFHQRLYRFLKKPPVLWFSALELLQVKDAKKATFFHSYSLPSLPTCDQKNAIAGISRVLFGHRKRPALLLANRGRGKSSAMGLAIAEIVKTHKKHLIVTSPSVANTHALFHHAKVTDLIQKQDKYAIHYTNGSLLEFIPPDVLLANQPECDLLLVDEAAAIPLPLLASFLSFYPRVVFASTEHGYEGTGRGFSQLFKALLNKKAKGWREYRLFTPIRYAKEDPLENWLFDTFLFNAEAVIPPPLLDPLEKKINYHAITKAQLLENEHLLKQVFALLVSSHYQTSPNELMHLLNDEDQLLWGAFYDSILVGLALAKKEGGFSPSLAEEVVAGKRRLKGHLLAQSLAAHTGEGKLLTSRVLRLSRVAVFEPYRRQSIGRHLLKGIEQTAHELGFDLVGCSFGVTPSLLSFWLNNGYQPVRLGVNRDAASGTYSLQLVKPLTQIQFALAELSQLFYANFLAQLPEQFKTLNAVIIADLLSNAPLAISMSLSQRLQIKQYSQGALGYDLIVGSLQAWVCYCLCHSTFWANKHPATSLVIEKVLQRHLWSDVGQKHQLKGRKQIEIVLRKWVADSLAALD